MPRTRKKKMKGLPAPLEARILTGAGLDAQLEGMAVATLVWRPEDVPACTRCPRCTASPSEHPLEKPRGLYCCVLRMDAGRLYSFLFG